jgi:hypothetical protein
MDQGWVHKLAEDVIDINCFSCTEFLKPLSKSCCMCPQIVELIGCKLASTGDLNEDNENAVATEWEKIRHDICVEVRKRVVGDVL